MKRKWKLVALTGLIVLGSAACSRQRTAANEWGCLFAGGPVENSLDLKKALGPGESSGRGNDNLVAGPSDVRFFYVDSDPKTADFGTNPIVVPAKGSSSEGVGVVQVRAEVQARFVLNENFCDLYIGNLKRVDETTPLNYNAKQGEESGWGQFLTLSMNQKLIEATRPVLAPVDYITLYVNGSIKSGEETGLAYDVLAKELSTNLSRELNKDLGADYFCGPSYQFDGVIDGKFGGNGCPPIEVTVKSIVPVDDTLIANLTAIVNNEEQQRKIESDALLAQEKAEAEADKAEAQAAADQRTRVAQAKADQAIQVAEAEAQREIQLAQEEQRRAVAQEKAETDLIVAQARAEVAAQEAENTVLTEQAKAAFCVALANVGIRCDLYASAQGGNSIIPQVSIDGSGGGAAPTVVLDAR
jgi:hypothetical protein